MPKRKNHSKDSVMEKAVKDFDHCKNNDGPYNMADYWREKKLENEGIPYSTWCDYASSKRKRTPIGTRVGPKILDIASLRSLVDTPVATPSPSPSPIPPERHELVDTPLATAATTLTAQTAPHVQQQAGAAALMLPGPAPALAPEFAAQQLKNLAEHLDYRQGFIYNRNSSWRNWVELGYLNEDDLLVLGRRQDDEMLQAFERRTREGRATYSYARELMRMDGTGTSHYRQTMSYWEWNERDLLASCKDMGASNEFIEEELNLLHQCIKSQGKVPYKCPLPSDSNQQTNARRGRMRRLLEENKRFQMKIALHRSQVGFGRSMVALDHILKQFDWWLVYYGEEESDLRMNLRKVLRELMDHPKYGHGT